MERKIHYDPFLNEDCEYDKGYCGTEISEDANVTNNKKYVTCKKCIKLFPEAEKEMQRHIEVMNEQADDFVDFMFEQRYSCDCGFKGCLDELKFFTDPITYDGKWKCPTCETILQH